MKYLRSFQSNTPSYAPLLGDFAILRLLGCAFLCLNSYSSIRSERPPMRQAFRCSAALLVALLASYVVAFHGFNAVAKQVMEQSQFQQTAGRLAHINRVVAAPIGF